MALDGMGDGRNEHEDGVWKLVAPSGTKKDLVLRSSLAAVAYHLMTTLELVALHGMGVADH